MREMRFFITKGKNMTDADKRDELIRRITAFGVRHGAMKVCLPSDVADFILEREQKLRDEIAVLKDQDPH